MCCTTRDKLRDMADIVRENLEKVQDKQIPWCDKNARLREFAPGDPVQVLLPTSTSKAASTKARAISSAEESGKSILPHRYAR